MTDFLVSSLHSCRLCAMAWVSAKDLLVHSAMLSIQLFFGLPLLRLPSTAAPCSITLVRPSDLVTCPYHFSFRRFTVARRSSYGLICFMMVFFREQRQINIDYDRKAASTWIHVSPLRGATYAKAPLDNLAKFSLPTPDAHRAYDVGLSKTFLHRLQNMIIVFYNMWLFIIL